MPRTTTALRFFDPINAPSPHLAAILPILPSLITPANLTSREGVWLADAPFMEKKDTEEVVEKDVRCRTIGDITCTGVTLSKANTLEDIIQEVAATRVTERGGRYDDKRSEAAMEDRKKEGYF